MSIIGRVTLQTRMFAVRRWRCCKALAAVKNFPSEGHCAMTNADKANEVQENAVTAKKGKKRSINAITSFQVKNPQQNIQNSDSCFFTTRVGGNICRGKYY